MDYYPIQLELDSTTKYLLWVTDTESDSLDVVLTDNRGRLIEFCDKSALQAYAAKHHFRLIESQPVRYDFDDLNRWVQAPDSSGIQCVEMLNAWNLFTDIASSVQDHSDQFQAVEKRVPRVYAKLFFGNNLAAITPAGECYVPDWSAPEVEHLRDVFTAGLTMLRCNLFD